MFEVFTSHAELTKEQEKNYNLKIHFELFDIVKTKETILSFETSEGIFEFKADVSGVITELCIDDETKSIRNGDDLFDITELNKNQLSKLNTIKENIIDDNYFGLLLLTDGYDTPNKISKMTYDEFKEVFGDEDDLKIYYRSVLLNAKEFLKKNNQNSQSQLLKSELNSIHQNVHVKHKANITKKNGNAPKSSFDIRDILSYEPKKLLIISLVPTILLCFLLYLWFNRYETIKHSLGSSIEVYVKENRLTGNRCTLKEGIIVQLPELRKSKFPNWC